MRKLMAGGVALAAAVFTLSGCSVSQDEKDRCEEGGGTVVTGARVPTGDEGFWARGESRSFNYCKLPDGTMGEVFEKEVTPADSRGKVHYWAGACQEKNGRLYDADEMYMIGKVPVTYHDYLCVAKGKVIKVHKEDDEAS